MRMMSYSLYPTTGQEHYVTHAVDFADVDSEDIDEYGGKVRELAHMLTRVGLNVPDGFAVPSSAYAEFMELEGLEAHVVRALDGLPYEDVVQIGVIAAGIRKRIVDAEMPPHISASIIDAYERLGNDIEVAVRSSATAEDGEDASYAGQQDTYLNVIGSRTVVDRVKDCWASFFSDRAVQTRIKHGHSHSDGICVGVQRMVQSAWAGTLFTINVSTGNPDHLVMEVGRGLGVGVVSGEITPDIVTYSRKQGRIIRWLEGHQPYMLVRRDVITDPRDPNYKVTMSAEDSAKHCLTEEDLLPIFKQGEIAHEAYGMPRDMEWALDQNMEDFTLQSRPVTAKSQRYLYEQDESELPGEDAELIGRALESAIEGTVTGRVRVLHVPEDADEDYVFPEKVIAAFGPDDILVARKTLPNIVPLMRIVKGVLTGEGGVTSHAAIIARETGVVTVVGIEGILDKVHDGMLITLDATYGCVFAGVAQTRLAANEDRLLRKQKLERVVASLVLEKPVSVILADGEQAAAVAAQGAKGVGLFREESYAISLDVHPYGLVATGRGMEYEELLLAGLVKMATPFYRGPDDYDIVAFRFYDSKSNEHATLEGFDLFMKEVIKAYEENPMLGRRGVSLFLKNAKTRQMFKHEVAAIHRARNEHGLKNVVPMFPFVRTPEEADEVLELMAEGEHGLRRGEDGLQVWMMAEITSNFIAPELFIRRPDGTQRFDVLSIGSNDAFQFAFGIDRDGGGLREIATEDHPIFRRLISMLIPAAHKAGAKVRICGQAPSNSISFLEFLLEEDIDAVSVNPDTLPRAILQIAEWEAKQRGEVLDLSSLLS